MSQGLNQLKLRRNELNQLKQSLIFITNILLKTCFNKSVYLKKTKGICATAHTNFVNNMIAI